jgi:hypothetical protein
MTDNQYLEKILESQAIKPGKPEHKNLLEGFASVESILRSKYDEDPLIVPAGSFAKHTMNLESYDLDVICYFSRKGIMERTSLGSIYQDVKTTLADRFFIEEKRSALRLKDKTNKIDCHIDVVPGRFIDDSDTVTYLHQTEGDHDYLQTDTKVHVRTIRDSGLTDAIRLLKLWNVRRAARVKTFVLELLAVEQLKGQKSLSLDAQLQYFWSILVENWEDLRVEDPANSRNDLSPLFDYSVRSRLGDLAQTTLEQLESTGLQTVYGPLPASQTDIGRIEIISRAAAAAPVKPQPWSS